MTKRVKGFLRATLVWAFLAGLWILSSQLVVAQLQAFPQPHPGQKQQSARQGNDERKQTFEGKIAKSDGKLVLEDEMNGVTYQLDDRQLAELFEGRQVKLTGTLHRESDTVYISDIGLSNTKHAAARAAPERHKLPAQTQYGIASWYRCGRQDRWTASGEPFDDELYTAAHRRLPLGTCVRVTNLKNGRSVVVRINDRGPYVPGRLIDLSKSAAERLGFVRQGMAPVRTSVV